MARLSIPAAPSSCLIVLEAWLVEPGGQLASLDMYLPNRTQPGHLIIACYLPHGTCAFAEISRTPGDLPILGVVV